MAVPDNDLKQVQTYQESNLAYLQNLNCFVSTCNTKFKDFENLTGNLGDTVTYSKPPRMTSTNSLIANFQSADQRSETLTVDQQISVSYAFTSQQLIFNVEDYMPRFGMAAQEEMSAKIEANVANNCVTAPYRFYGDGVTPINSFNQLASALSLFRNYGSAKGMAKGYLQDTAIPAIVGSGLNQFAQNRNNELANSWELGEFSRCEWYTSNLLPIHTAGNAGINGATMTVYATTLNADGAVTAITFTVSGAPGVDANSVKAYDKFQFNDGVSGHPNLRYLTFTGHSPSAVPVQFAATANAASDGSSRVTVLINPPLQANATNAQNLSYPIAVGMTCSVLPSHRAGLITAGNAFYLAMPRLPLQVPYPTANKTDPDTGVSFRQTMGSSFGLNTNGMVHDCIWGSKLTEEYSMSVIFPV